jgi:hypothetical protein
METKVKSKDNLKSSLKDGYTIEELAAIVARDPITSAEVCQILRCELQTLYKIPFEDLPHLRLNEKRKLYSKRLVLEFLAKRHKRFQAA